MMKVIFKAKKNGKTFDLIQRAHKLGQEGKRCHIVCHTKEESDRILEHAKWLGLKIRTPLTYCDLKNHYFHDKNVDSVLIDNADRFLERLPFLSAVQIDSITLTKEDEEGEAVEEEEDEGEQ